MARLQPGKTTNPLDRNALSSDRTRRNWQKILTGGVSELVSTDGTTIVRNAEGQLSVPIDGITIVVGGGTVHGAYTLSGPTAGNGSIAVTPSAAGPAWVITAVAAAGISLNHGIQVNVDGGAIQIVSNTVSLSLATNSGLVVVAGPPIGLTVQLADSSLALSGTGLSVHNATNGGLSTASGLVVTGFRTVTSAPGSPAVGDDWFNTTNDMPYVNTAGFGVAPIAFNNVRGPVATTANTAPQTIMTWAFPAGYLNRVNATVSLRIVMTGNAGALTNTFTFSIALAGTALLTFVSPTVLIGTQYCAIIDLDMNVESTGTTGSVFAAANGNGALIGSASQIGTPNDYAVGNILTFNLTSALNLTVTASAAFTNAGDTMGVFYAILTVKN